MSSRRYEIYAGDDASREVVYHLASAGGTLDRDTKKYIILLMDEQMLMPSNKMGKISKRSFVDKSNMKCPDAVLYHGYSRTGHPLLGIAE